MCNIFVLYLYILCHSFVILSTKICWLVRFLVRYQSSMKLIDTYIFKMITKKLILHSLCLKLSIVQLIEKKLRPSKYNLVFHCNINYYFSLISLINALFNVIVILRLILTSYYYFYLFIKLFIYVKQLKTFSMEFFFERFLK